MQNYMQFLGNWWNKNWIIISFEKESYGLTSSHMSSVRKILNINTTGFVNLQLWKTACVI